MATHPPSVLAYFKRVGAEILNFRRAMVKVHKGAYYVERALIRIMDDGSVKCPVKAYEPTPEEAALMKEELAGWPFPRIIKARVVDDLLPQLKGEYYVFKDRGTNEIVMVQERRVGRDGVKSYRPWVMLSDGSWACMEPEESLPFWMPTRRDGETGRFMIHEGAKAAAFVTDRLAAGGWNHPWAEALGAYTHIGMIGGALAAHRTDYAMLVAEKPLEVVYVCDNDTPGVSALQKVSECWGRSMRGVVFGADFPPSWDMADPMPKTRFTEHGRFRGPWIKDLLKPATYATELIPPEGGKGRPKAVLRTEFIEEWLHAVRPAVFLHREWPNDIMNEAQFENSIAPFSHVRGVSLMLQRHMASKSAVLDYDPGRAPGVYAGDQGQTVINTYQPSGILPEKGDAGPWLEFMEFFVPDAGDRHETFRWIATLVSRPDIRPHYGILAISSMQGVGKGTLGEKILAPLVGKWNCSFPSEEQITDSSFDYWSPHRILAVVHEIYAGHSSKAYNKLKSRITDSGIEVNQKFQAVYTIDNHIRVFACSNSDRALQLAADDRRWFVPKISNRKWSPDKLINEAYWERFNMWLAQDGGLNIIRWWCDEWIKNNSPALHGSDAPSSETKTAIIEEGFSPGQKLILNLIRQMKFQGGEGFILDSHLVKFVKDQLWDGRHNDKLERPATLRTVALKEGMKVGEVQAQIKDWGLDTFGARVLAFDAGTAAMTPGELHAAGRRPVDLSALVGL